MTTPPELPYATRPPSPLTLRWIDDDNDQDGALDRIQSAISREYPGYTMATSLPQPRITDNSQITDANQVPRYQFRNGILRYGTVFGDDDSDDDDTTASEEDTINFDDDDEASEEARLIALEEEWWQEETASRSTGGHAADRIVEPPGNIGELLCSVCLDVQRDSSLITACGHSFCHSCIVEVFKSQRVCPTCRSAVKHFDPVDDMHNRRCIDQLHIRCDQTDCMWVGRVDKLAAHFNDKHFYPSLITS